MNKPSKANKPAAAYVAKTRIYSKSGDTLAAPGETCEQVPASSLDWLCRQGYIERVKDE